MKHKVATLEGAPLDAAVAKAEGAQPKVVRSISEWSGCFSPSQSWQHGGPLIERERIELFSPRNAPAWNRWEAKIAPDGDLVRIKAGPTALIAAMRAYVASKLGEEIELP